MTTTGTCPSCGCAQPQNLLCASDTAALRTMLQAVPQLVDQLDVAVAKQAKVASGGNHTWEQALREGLAALAHHELRRVATARLDERFGPRR